MQNVSNHPEKVLDTLPEPITFPFREYAFLACGRVYGITAKETPSIPPIKSESNDLLIKRFARFLKEFCTESKFVKVQCGKLSGRWLTTITTFSKENGPVVWDQNLLVYSTPYNGVSYVHAVVIRGRNSPTSLQVNASFVATTPVEIAWKLVELKLFDFRKGGAK